LFYFGAQINRYYILNSAYENGGSNELIEFLLVNSEQAIEYGFYPTNFFLRFCRDNKTDLVCKLLDHGYKSQTKHCLEPGGQGGPVIWSRDASGIHLACWNGNIKMIEKFLEKGAQINDLDCNNNPPLFIAIESAKGLEIVDYLLNKDARMTSHASAFPYCQLAQGLNNVTANHDIEKICRNVVLLISQKKEQPILSFNDLLLVKNFYSDKRLPSELIQHIMGYVLLDRSNQLVEAMPWDKLMSNNRLPNEKKEWFKEQIIKDAHEKLNDLLCYVEKEWFKEQIIKYAHEKLNDLLCYAEMEEFLLLFKKHMADFLRSPCFGQSAMYFFYRENRDKIGRCIEQISPIESNFFLLLCCKNDFELVSKSIQCGYTDVNAFYTTNMIHEVSSSCPQIERVKPIHFACYYGNKKMIDLLVEKGATLNDPDSDGIFPLDWARNSIRGLQIVDHIIRKGGGPFYRNYKSKNIELANLEGGFLDTLDWIFDKKSTLRLEPGDCEKICRNISLLFQFTQDDLGVFLSQSADKYRNDHKKFKLPWKLVSGAEGQLIRYFDKERKLPKELSIKILEMDLHDKADQLLERIPFDRFTSCSYGNKISGNELKSLFKEKIVADAYPIKEKIVADAYQTLDSYCNACETPEKSLVIPFKS
jgi:ankyrin repeat protein